ncbi:MAG: hypothetical protein K2Y05_10590, partial [Hyphomicrobiaceae bacterium]|nr:hypothetical protein [Hyphomicrobiaceae bacterium]
MKAVREHLPITFDNPQDLAAKLNHSVLELIRSTTSLSQTIAHPPVGRPTQIEKTIIGVVTNERTRHIDRAHSGFVEKLDELLVGHRYLHEIGSANNESAGHAANNAAFDALIARAQKTYGRKPDLLVTIGTQVSVFAREHHATTPHYFLSVSDPVGSELVSIDDLIERAYHRAGFANGIDRSMILEEISRHFPGKRVGFVYGENQIQDLQMVRFFDLPAIQTIAPPIKLLRGSLDSPRFDDAELSDVDVVFGWNLLSTNIDLFVNANPGVPFIGQHYEHRNSDVMASFGYDFRELGVAAAEV